MGAHDRRTMVPRIALAFTLLLALVAPLQLSSAPHAAAAVTSGIVGTGSSFAANAVDVAIADSTTSGLRVVYTGSGSPQGRRDFGNGNTDYAVSDLPYLGTDPSTGVPDIPCPQGAPTSCRPYAYLPAVAGATAFSYHLEVGGQAIRNLRLSGLTLAKIFTGQITHWNDPAIAADNNGVALPALAIIPVTHSEQSAVSYVFSSYLAHEFPSLWQGFSGLARPTPYYPAPADGVQYNGSSAVLNFVTAPAGNGAIGIGEYSYALGSTAGVVQVQNAAGYYISPTPNAVALTLTRAAVVSAPGTLNDQTEQLQGVFDDPDARAYPLSSYSYFIIPTGASGGTETRMTTSKRQALADFVHQTVCGTQAEIGPIGYAPLPLNLVQQALSQVQLLKSADPAVDLSEDDLAHCATSTFNRHDPTEPVLDAATPQPPACAQAGHGPCQITASQPTTTAVAVNVGAGSVGAPVTVVATVTGSGSCPSGSVTFLDRLDGNLGTAPVVAATCMATLVLSNLSISTHTITATFSGSDGSSVSVGDSGPFTVSAAFCVNACSDPQALDVTVPAGALIISTPYTRAHPLDLGAMSLNADATELTASAAFGSPTTPAGTDPGAPPDGLTGSTAAYTGNGVTITDTRPGSHGWTASAQTTDFTGPGTNLTPIPGDNLRFDGVLAKYLPGNALQSGAVTTTPIADFHTAPQPFATTTQGPGTVDVYGVLSLTAPTSTLPGQYTATITFTIV